MTFFYALNTLITVSLCNIYNVCCFILENLESFFILLIRYINEILIAKYVIIY